jgi:multicomponent Na+:H+ antiporter subunit G
MRDWIVSGLLLVGAGFMLLGALGVARFPDVLMRLQSVAKAGTVGIGCVLLGVALHFGSVGVAIWSGLVGLFLALTTPVAAQVIGRVAYLARAPLWRGTRFDEWRRGAPAAEVASAPVGRRGAPGDLEAGSTMAPVELVRANAGTRRSVTGSGTDAALKTRSEQEADHREGRDPFRRVLAVVSFDTAGLKAARRAACLPLAAGARVALLHAYPPRLSLRARAASERQARRELERFTASAAEASLAAGNRDLELVQLVSEGRPSAEVVRCAWQERAEIVVLGAPPVSLRHGAIRETIFGVMRAADLPILVARHEAQRGYRRLLCAADGSVTMVDTVALAARIASGSALGFTLFHAYHVPFEEWLGSDAPEIEEEAAARLRAVARTVRDEAAVVRVLVRRGDPCLGILRASLEERADLIALGTHGRSGLSRAVHGSVAEWVIANAPCDVTVARPHRFTIGPR